VAPFVSAIALASLLATDAGSMRMRHLEAWAGYGSPHVGLSVVRFQGPLLRHASPGAYRVHVWALSDMPFHLYGPGVDRRTARRAHFQTTYETWSVRLRRGVYHYRAEGEWARALRANGVAIQRSFAVP
jgi:hypothetical protein